VCDEQEGYTLPANIPSLHSTVTWTVTPRVSIVIRAPGEKMNEIDADAVYKLADFDSDSNQADGLGRAVREAIEVLEEALDTYGEHLSLSFNGGKDCTVLLHIYAAVLSRRRRRGQRTPSSSTATSSAIPTIYIPMPSPFPEMESFIDSAAKEYNLDIFRVPCAEGSSGKKGMKEALELYQHVKPGVKAILIGIRRGDPFSDKLTHKDMTDKDWPEFMRIHPIIDWTYPQVWKFLRILKVNYCSLYDQGYTSLGSTYNTYPNPALRVEADSTDSRSAVFKPAYELKDGSLERCGRVTVSQPPTSIHSPAYCIPSPGQGTTKDGVPYNRITSPAAPTRTVEQLHT